MCKWQFENYLWVKWIHHKGHLAELCPARRNCCWQAQWRICIHILHIYIYTATPVCAYVLSNRKPMTNWRTSTNFGGSFAPVVLERLKDESPFGLQQGFFCFCERLLNLFFWAFERDTIQQDAMGSANKVFPPPPQPVVKHSTVSIYLSRGIKQPHTVAMPTRVSFSQTGCVGWEHIWKQEIGLFGEAELSATLSSDGCDSSCHITGLCLNKHIQEGAWTDGHRRRHHPDTVDYGIMSVLCVET